MKIISLQRFNVAKLKRSNIVKLYLHDEKNIQDGAGEYLSLICANISGRYPPASNIISNKIPDNQVIGLLLPLSFSQLKILIKTTPKTKKIDMIICLECTLNLGEEFERNTANKTTITN